MLGETVVSIIESAATGSGEWGVISRYMAMSSAEYAAFAQTRTAQIALQMLPHQTAAWVERIQYLRQIRALGYLKALALENTANVAFQNAVAQIASQEAMVGHAARIAAANAAATAAEGTLVAGAGTTAACIVLPVVAIVAVGVALGAPYYQAREEAKKEEHASAFAKGFITGLLKWEVRFTIDRFWDNGVGKNGFDESMPAIRAAAHNEGLLKGRIAGLAKDDGEKKTYLEGLRKLTKVSSAGWSARSGDWAERMRARRVQISYVIDLSAAARKHKIIAAE